MTEKKENANSSAEEKAAGRTPQGEKKAASEKGAAEEKGSETAVSIPAVNPQLEGFLRSMQSKYASLEIVPDPHIVKVKIEGHELVRFLEELKHAAEWKMDLLLDITAVDYKEYFSLVYVLSSLSYGHRIMVKCNINDYGNPITYSISHIYPAAEVMEREVYDLMGIDFWGHPHLERILLPEDFIGHPLRKDFKAGTGSS